MHWEEMLKKVKSDSLAAACAFGEGNWNIHPLVTVVYVLGKER